MKKHLLVKKEKSKIAGRKKCHNSLPFILLTLSFFLPTNGITSLRNLLLKTLIRGIYQSDFTDKHWLYHNEFDNDLWNLKDKYETNFLIWKFPDCIIRKKILNHYSVLIFISDVIIGLS